MSQSKRYREFQLFVLLLKLSVSLGNKCGGNFRYNDRGIKDCTGCILPHKKENYEYIVEKFGEISKIARQNKE